MKILKTLVPIFAAAAILTGCGGPSESDCANTVNKLLQKDKAYVYIPGELDSSSTDQNWVFIIPVPTDDPLTNGDDSLYNRKFKGSFGTDRYKSKFQKELKIAKLFEQAGYMKIKEGIFDKLVKINFSDKGTLYKIAGYQITFTDKIKPHLIPASFLGGPRIKIGNFAVDKITKIDSKAQKYDDYEVYSFSYTQKVENLLEGLSDDIIDMIKDESSMYHHFKERSTQIYKENSEWTVPSL